MSHIAEACCTNPPVLSEDYKPVGKYVTISGLNTYAVGPSDATKGVIFVYDALGWTHQTYTAADMLSSHLTNAVVLMPDLFEGKPLEFKFFSLPQEERTKILTEWMSTVAEPTKNKAAVEGVIAHAHEAGYEKVSKWGAFGLCWGGKLTALMSGSGTPLSAAGAGHPGRPDPEEAKAMVIPYVCLLSPEDAPLEQRQAYEKALNENKIDAYVETYEDRVHGWMGARCDFKDEKARAEFDRGYKKVAEFMNKHLA